jgi:hypothetical protein
MAREWGPVEKPVEHNVKPIAAEAEGAVVEIEHSGTKASPGSGENYNASDGRHNKADHGGWPSIDGKSGTHVGEDGEAHGKFPDGPGKWRQT